MQTAEKIRKQARYEAKEKADKLAAQLNKDKIKEVFYNPLTKESLLVTYLLTADQVTCLVEYKNFSTFKLATFNYTKTVNITRRNALNTCFVFCLYDLINDQDENKHHFTQSLSNVNAYNLLQLNGFESIHLTGLWV